MFVSFIYLALYHRIKQTIPLFMQNLSFLFALQLGLFTFYLGTIVRLVFTILFDNPKTK